LVGEQLAPGSQRSDGRLREIDNGSGSEEINGFVANTILVYTCSDPMWMTSGYADIRELGEPATITGIVALRRIPRWMDVKALGCTLWAPLGALLGSRLRALRARKHDQ
jgi:hypothetical protein